MTEKPGAEIRRRLASMQPPRSQGWLSLHAQIDAAHLSRIVKGDARITGSIALKLSQALGDDPEFWARLQADFDVAKARRDVSVVEL